MIQEVKAVIARSQATLLADALGAVALMAILIVGLHLPNLT
ncbi:hypothetical protein [Lentibacter algarum]|nr:hypothetical protein [Lentibacter algarum]